MTSLRLDAHAQPPPSTSSAASSETLSAWHIASILLHLGRPTHLLHLASVSQSTQSAIPVASPHHILRLCLLPNSPIDLADGQIVTLSCHAFSAFARFVTSGCGLSVERVWYRKRKRHDAVENCSSPSTTTEGRDESILRLDATRTKIGGHQKGEFCIDKDEICNIRISQSNVPAGKRPRSMPLLGSEGKQLSLESRKSEEQNSIDESTLSVTKDRVQEEPESLYHACEAEVYSRLSNENTFVNVMPKVGLEKGDVVEAREPIGNEYIPEKYGDANVQSGTNLNEKECVHHCNEAVLHRPSERCLDQKREVSCTDVRTVIQNKTSFSVSRPSISPLMEFSNKRKSHPKYIASSSMKAIEVDKKKSVQTYKRKINARKVQSTAVAKQRVEHDFDISVHAREGEKVSTNQEDQVETKGFPSFESYVVEEEEGSGGYGTVYRARRRNDWAVVAIKCPHAKANRLHVTNELEMLERFGGKNSIIKYEGCFKSGDSDCFVLEHVKHDRPEVLKKTMDIFQLQWYGYCLFRALASLHKQGVVHRDVKPGNFLYSCKAIKGYLIDFNLAMDVYQKYGTKRITDGSSCKSGLGDAPVSMVPKLPNAKSLSPMKTTKYPGGRSLNYQNWESKRSKLQEDKNFKRKDLHQVKSCNEIASRSTRSQGADGSGITSAKDASNMTPSGERVREPMPRQGRKELISLLHEAMHTNQEASSIPAPMRKRVAAPPGKLEGKHVIISPMPLHLKGIAVPGAAAAMKSHQRKEGPCTGTKGFRAPEVVYLIIMCENHRIANLATDVRFEVLLKSFHQGPKLDVWSAGVTLLYLILGRMPFVGDPEQNIKDIAKFRGSEDIWEVARLHGRESSLPAELYDVRALPSVSVREFCQKSTKRPDLIESIPESLYNLLEKCLTVNPRLRLSAEEALRHEFFGPCLEDLRKLKLHRLGMGQDDERRYHHPAQTKS